MWMRNLTIFFHVPSSVSPLFLPTSTSRSTSTWLNLTLFGTCRKNFQNTVSWCQWSLYSANWFLANYRGNFVGYYSRYASLLAKTYYSTVTPPHKITARMMYRLLRSTHQLNVQANDYRYAHVVLGLGFGFWVLVWSSWSIFSVMYVCMYVLCVCVGSFHP